MLFTVICQKKKQKKNKKKNVKLAIYSQLSVAKTLKWLLTVICIQMCSQRRDTRNNITLFCMNGCGILFFDIEALITFCVSEIRNHTVYLILMKKKKKKKKK